MYKSMLISELKIKEKTKKALHHLGYTETDNFIGADDIILAKILTKCQYIDLAIAIAGIKSSIFWEDIHNHNIQSDEPRLESL